MPWKWDVLARLYLMTLYIIFPFHLKFSMRLMCVFKHITHRKKTNFLMVTWQSFFFFKKMLFWYCTCTWYLINFSILSWPVPVFHVSLSITHLLFLPYHVLYTRFFLNIYKAFSLWQFSFNIKNTWKNLFSFI